jgi:hypothetical protein
MIWHVLDFLVRSYFINFFSAINIMRRFRAVSLISEMLLKILPTEWWFYIIFIIFRNKPSSLLVTVAHGRQWRTGSTNPIRWNWNQVNPDELQKFRCNWNKVYQDMLYSIAGEAESSMQLKLSVYVKMFINCGLSSHLIKMLFCFLNLMKWHSIIFLSNWHNRLIINQYTPHWSHKQYI